MSWRASDPTPAREGRLFVISSPSGGGKTTVVRDVLRRVPHLVRSISLTTRPRRRTERDGVAYRFVSIQAFERLRRAGRLVEWAKVHHALYGTPEQPLVRALHRGDDAILTIDIQGARQIRRRFGRRAVLVFLLPPSLEDLNRRLARRGTDTPEAIRRRLQAARRELSCVSWYDYAIVNRKLSDAISQLQSVIVAERVRVRGRGR